MNPSNINGSISSAQMRYYRRPGQTVNYSGYQTARYVSKRARWQRGALIRPNWQRDKSGGGYEFGFYSSRGPVIDQGHWIVTATEPSGDCGGGGDGGGGGGGDWTNGEPAASDLATIVTEQRLRYFLPEQIYNQGDLGSGTPDGHPIRPWNLQPYPYLQDVFPFGGAQTVDSGRSTEGSYQYDHSIGTYFPDNSVPYPGYLLEYSRVVIKFAWGVGLPPVDRVNHWHDYYYEIANYGISSISA